MKRLAFVVTLAVACTAAHAAKVEYTVDFFISSTGESGGFEGSEYRAVFIADYAATDTDALADFGEFPDSVTFVSLSLLSGSYDPGGGTFSGGRVNTEESDTGLTFSMFGASGFNEIEAGRPLVGLTFNAFAIYDAGLTINDTGAGQTLLEQTGGIVDLNEQAANTGNSGIYLNLFGPISSGRYTSSSFQVLVPEPASAALLVIAGGVLLRRRVRHLHGDRR